MCLLRLQHRLIFLFNYFSLTRLNKVTRVNGVVMFHVDSTHCYTNLTSYYMGTALLLMIFFTSHFGIAFVHYTFSFCKKKIVQLHKYTILQPWKWLKHSIESYTTSCDVSSKKKIINSKIKKKT